jgi:hypothetical protein
MTNIAKNNIRWRIAHAPGFKGVIGFLWMRSYAVHEFLDRWRLRSF